MTRLNPAPLHAKLLKPSQPMQRGSWLAAAVAAASLALSGCAPAQTASTDAGASSAAAGGTCSAVNAQFIRGKTVDPRLAEEARVRAGARNIRVLRPGQIATLEYDMTRLNIRVGDDGRIDSVDCG